MVHDLEFVGLIYYSGESCKAHRKGHFSAELNIQADPPPPFFDDDWIMKNYEDDQQPTVIHLVNPLIKNI